MTTEREKRNRPDGGKKTDHNKKRGRRGEPLGLRKSEKVSAFHTFYGNQGKGQDQVETNEDVGDMIEREFPNWKREVAGRLNLNNTTGRGMGRRMASTSGGRRGGLPGRTDRISVVEVSSVCDFTVF